MKFFNKLQTYKKYYFLFLIFALCILFLPAGVFAQTYGGGNYGGGGYGMGDVSSNNSGNSNNSGGNGNSSAIAPVCSNTPPANNPQWLYATIPQNGTSAMLYFTDASSPYDHYVVEYGLSAGNYSFGLDNAGGVGTRTVLIKNLLPSVTYYFRVRAGNGCATGPWSNEISTKTQPVVSTNNLVVTSTQVTPEQDTSQGPTPQPTQQETSGYIVNVLVKDIKNQPISGATVTLHSTPQTARTDKDGVATFQNIDKGQHQVLIAYNNYQGQETINLEGNVKTFTVTIQVKPVNVLVSPIAYLMIGVLIAIIILLSVFLLLKKRKS